MTIENSPRAIRVAPARIRPPTSIPLRPAAHQPGHQPALAERHACNQVKRNRRHAPSAGHARQDGQADDGRAKLEENRGDIDHRRSSA